jgi:hypothetical protein
VRVYPREDVSVLKVRSDFSVRASLFNLVGHSFAKWPTPSYSKHFSTAFVCVCLVPEVVGLC